MSTLISRLGRRFREKPKSNNLPLPPLPSAREILEDVEGIQGGDPIIRLAVLIQKKGRQASLLDKDFLEDPAAAPGGGDKVGSDSDHLEFLVPYQINSGTCGVGAAGDEGKGDTSGGQKGNKRKGSLTGLKGGKGNKGLSMEEQLNNYNKLKQFLLLFDKSEEILEGLEPHFKRVEKVLKECGEEGKGEIKADVKKEKEMEGIQVKLEGDLLFLEGNNGGAGLRARQISEGSDVCSSPLL